MKIVINKCYGGFGLSNEAMYYYANLKGTTLYPDKDRLTPTFWLTPTAKAEYDFLYQKAKNTVNYTEANVFFNKNVLYDRNIERSDPDLVKTVEDLGTEKASGMCAKLVVVDIEPGTAYRITEYDGMESIETNEDIDWKIAT